MTTAPFYDLATSMSFCASSTAMSGDPSTKTGREVYCLERLLRQCTWGERVSEQPLNLIDLGSGSGQKALRILDSIVADVARLISYVPIDTSRYSASFAILTVLDARQSLTDDAVTELFDSPPELPGSESPQPLQSDCSNLARRMAEHPPGASTVTRQYLTVPSRGVSVDFIADVSDVARLVRTNPAYVEGVNVYALLGQTLGNYSPADRHRFLTQLCSSMDKGDVLLIDAGLRPEDGGAGDLDERPHNLEAAYAREAWAFMRHKADDWSSRFRVAYEPRLHRIDHWFERPDGSAQILGYSYLFARSEVLRLLEGAGYRVVRTVSSLEEAGLHPGPECMVIMAQRP